MALPAMSHSSDYVIRGGLEGRERLRVLGRVMHASAVALFERCGLGDGMVCLDAGCGGGDATLEIARRVAPAGRVVGIDIDAEKVRIAREEGERQHIANVEFRVASAADPVGPAFDVVHARFLLTHLRDPAGTLDAFRRQLRPGGLLIVQDIELSAQFACPPSLALRRHQELYRAAVKRRGADPDIGPRLPALLTQAGFDGVEVAVVQPVGLAGEAKSIAALTMENIADAVLAEGLASHAEIDYLAQQLHELAADPTTLTGMPRVFQVWGRRGAKD